jgi:hypothetical protein
MQVPLPFAKRAFQAPSLEAAAYWFADMASVAARNICLSLVPCSIGDSACRCFIAQRGERMASLGIKSRTHKGRRTFKIQSCRHSREWSRSAEGRTMAIPFWRRQFPSLLCGISASAAHLVPTASDPTTWEPAGLTVDRRVVFRASRPGGKQDWSESLMFPNADKSPAADCDDYDRSPDPITRLILDFWPHFQWRNP